MYVGRTGRIGGDSPIVELLGATNILHKINFENFHGTDIGWYFFLPNFQYFFLSNSSIFSSLVQASVRAHFFKLLFKYERFFRAAPSNFTNSLLCTHARNCFNIRTRRRPTRSPPGVVPADTCIIQKRVSRGNVDTHRRGNYCRAPHLPVHTAGGAIPPRRSSSVRDE